MTLRERILIVDDDAAGRYVKVHILRRAGYEVTEAATARDALRIAAESLPALMLLDVNLPDMSGIEVCRQIKAQAPSILVLQTSAAFTGKHDRAAGLVGGADSYLVEPIEPEELTASVEALLRLRRVEQELRHSAANLEAQVAERTQELAKTNLRLLGEMEQRVAAERILHHAQKMDVLGQLTGGIAHDFNNLLAIILGNLESLRRGLARNGEAKMLTFADNAFFGARRAATLTRQLLSFARRQSAAPKAISPARWMEDMTALLRQTLGERIAVEAQVPVDIWPIYVDQGELEAALLNLAVNARDAMSGEGSLRIAFENVTAPLVPGQLPAGDHVAIRVTDSGSGMSEEVIKFAFEPFFTTKGVGEGTGLGLSQVYGFTKQAQGRAAIDSKPGAGTTVTLLLPRHRGPVPAEDAEQVFIPGAGDTATTILVVEDNDHLRAHTVEIMHELGYRVEQAGTGRAALAVLAENPDIALMFSDIGLPGGMDGIALAAAAQAMTPALKVLLTTGYAQDTLKLPPGMRVIAKPFTFAALSQKMRDLLSLDSARPGDEMRVVLVEDEALIRMNTAEMLRERGFAVDEAGSAGEAMGLIAKGNGNIGAVIIDIGLPDRRGDDLAEELHAKNPALPVIIASGHAPDAVRARFKTDPQVAFVGKPYAIEDLERAIKGLRPH